MIKQLFVALAISALACSSDEQPKAANASDSNPVTAATQSGTDSPSYQFDRPSLSLVLPEELLEVSGLTALPGGRLGTVQDEDGVVYVLNRESGTVEGRLPFGDNGDYEGIEWVGDKAYVLMSGGTVIELSGSLDDMRQTATYETSLKRKNDAEGLGYDSARGRLLIACKEDPGSGLDDDQRAIYAFDPASGELSSEPAYVIDTKEVEKKLSKGGPFKPSGVAVHPLSGDVYVLSSTSRSVVVLSGHGTLEAVHALSKDAFEQPEGIAFLPDGTLYISSEGDKGPAMLYEFKVGASE